MIEAVVFDVGETLIDETRGWNEWADWLSVPRFTFHATLGGLIGRGEDHRAVYELVRPGVDMKAERARRAASSLPERLEPEDLYPDALPCLSALMAAGLRVGIAGNQPEWIEEALREVGFRVDLIASSAAWGVHKPDPAFFARIAAVLGTAPEAIAYVGDRVDNDVLPAKAAGMTSVFLRRGPWGILQANQPGAAATDIRLDSLTELPVAIAAVQATTSTPARQPLRIA